MQKQSKSTNNKKHSQLNMTKSLLLILPILFSFVTLTEFKCELDGTSSNIVIGSKIEKGNNSLLCVHFLPYNIKMSFNMGVDEYAMVTGKHIFDVISDGSLGSKDVDMVLQLSGSNLFSQQIPYYRIAEKIVFSIVSILIHVKEGEITKIELEDLKDACPKDSTIPTVLPLEYSFTAENKVSLCGQQECTDNTNGLCDLKVFVSWIGTDSQGNSLISNLDRLLNFSKYNLETMYQSMLVIENQSGDDTLDAYDSNQIPDSVKNRISSTSSL